jgi:hypothetical protein
MSQLQLQYVFPVLENEIMWMWHTGTSPQFLSTFIPKLALPHDFYSIHHETLHTDSDTMIKHEFGLHKQIMITFILRLQATIISQETKPQLFHTRYVFSWII